MWFRPAPFFLAESANVFGPTENGGRGFYLSEFPLRITLVDTASKLERDSVESAKVTHHVFGNHSRHDQCQRRKETLRGVRPTMTP